MTLATKLRGAFAIYIALLAALLVYHVQVVRRSVDRGHDLAAISARYRVISNEQQARVAEMSRVAEKFLVTRDVDYVERFVELAREQSADLQRLDAAALGPSERQRLASLATRWREVERLLCQSEGAQRPGDPHTAAASCRPRHDSLPPGGAGAVPGMTDMASAEVLLDAVAVETTRLAEATQAAMNGELTAWERTALSAERVSWVAAAGALLLSALLSALLVRSIVRPIQRLTRGTREISAGRFDYRLEAHGRDELAQVSRDFNAMTERLDELDRMKREFVSNVSHDLKTPLSSMQETTAILLEELPGRLTDKQRRLLSLNLEGGQRLSAMIGKLLELSRLESAPAPQLEATDLAAIARRVVDRVVVARAGRGPAVMLEAPAHHVVVAGAADALEHVLDNLLENAIKFSPPDGAIRVSLEERDGSVVLRVSDDGPGIPDADKDRVFERFYQTAAGRSTPARGVGLGLAICRHIVESHHGRIGIADNAPRGTVVWVSLPAYAFAERLELAGAGPAWR